MLHQRWNEFIDTESVLGHKISVAVVDGGIRNDWMSVWPKTNPNSEFDCFDLTGGFVVDEVDNGSIIVNIE